MTPDDLETRLADDPPCAYCGRRRRTMKAVRPIPICTDCHRQMFGRVLDALAAPREQP